MSENQKATKYEKEIPINIGHLPMRLRQKIADQLHVSGGSGSGSGASASSGCERLAGDIVKRGANANNRDANQNIRQSRVKDDCNYVSSTSEIDVLPKKAPLIKKILPTPTSTIQIASKTAIVRSSPKVEDFSIPGILRIKPTDENPSKQNSKLSSPQRQATPQRQVPRLSTSDPAWFAQIYEKDITFAKELPSLHAQINTINANKSYVENWSEFNFLRTQLQSIYSQFIISKIKFCCEQNVESYFWRTLFYNAIEFFKKNLSNSQIRRTQIIELITDGHTFYTSLYAILDEKYLNTKYDNDHSKNELLGKVSAQKISINLGDLSRYISKFSKASDYAKAIYYYERAQGLIPSNGIPYNQLAIVSIYMKNNLDAVYYHMRSLMSSNPIQSAKESLKVFFDESRKKYEENESNGKSPERSSYKDRHNSMRKEVWIYPDGGRRLHRTDFFEESEEEFDQQLMQLPKEELLKRFTLTYLYLIGKLFSGIGFENFNKTLEKLIATLKIVLHRDPLCISRSRLFKLLALNIFVVEHNLKSESRKEIRNRAFNVMSLFLAFVVNSANKQLMRLSSIKINSTYEDISEDLSKLLQFIKISCDWFSKNPRLFIEIPRNEEFNVELHSEFLQMCHSLEKLGNFNHTNSTAAIYQSAILDEDNFLNGFIPLGAIKHNVIDHILSENDQTSLRIGAILCFGNCFLKEFSSKELDMECRESLNDHPQFEKLPYKLNQTEYTQSIGNIPADEINMDIYQDECLQLSKLRKELEEKSKLNKIYDEKLKKILQDVDSAQYIEVRPRYLVPDTNCFIDSLDELELLAKQFQRFYLIVPLIVVKELDGLSKGCSGTEGKPKHHRIHHYDEVATLSKKSLEFIKTNNHVKCATTKGSILSSSMFAFEDDENMSNDDKILATALSLQKDSISKGIKDGMSFVETELVLITTDRNLRVKAHSRNLIVSGLKEFLEWASNETQK